MWQLTTEVQRLVDAAGWALEEQGRSTRCAAGSRAWRRYAVTKTGSPRRPAQATRPPEAIVLHRTYDSIVGASPLDSCCSATILPAGKPGPVGATTSSSRWTAFLPARPARDPGPPGTNGIYDIVLSGLQPSRTGSRHRFSRPHRRRVGSGCVGALDDVGGWETHRPDALRDLARCGLVAPCGWRTCASVGWER